MDAAPLDTSTEVGESLRGEADRALAPLRAVATGSGPMTAPQLTVAVRGLARALLVIVRLQLGRHESID